jgi:rod shape-determining protein MreB and related proteins
MLHSGHPALPAGAVMVACRPVLTTPQDEIPLRRLLEDVFRPSRVLFIDTVRAAAIGSGAGPGTLVVADVGAQLTEVAMLADGIVAAARRTEIGMSDLLGTDSTDPVLAAIADMVVGLRRDPRSRSALRGGILLVGGGAAQPALAARIAARLGVAVRVAAQPRISAVHGAGLAALAALRRRATTVAGPS